MYHAFFTLEHGLLGGPHSICNVLNYTFKITCQLSLKILEAMLIIFHILRFSDVHTQVNYYYFWYVNVSI